MEEIELDRHELVSGRRNNVVIYLFGVFTWHSRAWRKSGE